MKLQHDDQRVILLRMARGDGLTRRKDEVLCRHVRPPYSHTDVNRIRFLLQRGLIRERMHLHDPTRVSYVLTPKGRDLALWFRGLTRRAYG